MSTRKYIPNQVFIGCPWKTIKAKYVKITNEFNKEYPMCFTIIGERGTQDADDLFTEIKSKLLSSSYAVFDATGGNANVSLEYGLADGCDIPKAIYLSEHLHSRKTGKEKPIISDLAGKKRNVYKVENGLKRLLKQLCETHDYTKRFKNFLHQFYSTETLGQKKRKKALCLKIIHSLDDNESIRRSDLISSMLADGYTETEISQALNSMKQAVLITCSSGRYSTVTISKK